MEFGIVDVNTIQHSNEVQTLLSDVLADDCLLVSTKDKLDAINSDIQLNITLLTLEYEGSLSVKNQLTGQYSLGKQRFESLLIQKKILLAMN